MIGSSKSVCAMSFVQHDFNPAPAGRVKKVNHYALRAKLGSGSSSNVYLGIDDRTSEAVAVKRIRLRELARNTSGLAQLEREIRLMKLFSHPNILKITEVLHVPSADEAYLILEYADKGSLGSFLDRGVQFPIPAVFSIMKQVVSAIQYLHASGYVHQDIKPCNILITGSGRALLADFGIGHSFDSAAMVVGSPAYQAPEALSDDYAAGEDESESSIEGPQKEDIWALGVTFYQLLFMSLPFQGSNLFEIVNYIKEHQLQIPEGTDPEISKLLLGMLSVDPMQRFGIEDLLVNPLIATASDLAPDLPEVPTPVLKDGDVVELEAKICRDGYSFAATPLAIPRRFSFHAAYSQDLDDSDETFQPRKLGLPGTRTEDGNSIPMTRRRSRTDPANHGSTSLLLI
jgi:serine/threonine protein kinase